MAQKSPDDFLSIIIDGMDQDKLGIPRWTVKSKNEEKHDKLKQKLIGVKCHGLDPPVRGYFVDAKYGSDSNVTCEVLRRIFDDIGYDKLPKKLFLQLDNTCATNKNSM